MNDNRSVPKPGDNVHIPLPEHEAIRLAMLVKPTADMPRPGAHAMGPKKPRKTKPKRGKA